MTWEMEIEIIMVKWYVGSTERVSTHSSSAFMGRLLNTPRKHEANRNGTENASLNRSLDLRSSMSRS